MKSSARNKKSKNSNRRGRSKRPQRSRRRRSEPEWVALPDHELLDLRFCDLGVKLAGTHLEERIEMLYDELKQRGLRFRPHCWLSSEWFSPDDSPGVALPFYLAHPRLMRLEYRQMFEVEGAAADWCMRLLRHETGHAIDSAYRLRRRKRWQDLFGNPAKAYPNHYRPNPRSRKHVLHLDSWYAQSHPTEDFAETFAVWLKPGSGWRRRYKDWPVLEKLEYVDDVMRKLAGKVPPVRSRKHVDPLSKNRSTLREHYRAKKAHYLGDYVDVYDRDLYRLFSPSSNGGPRRSAAAFLKRARAELRRAISQGTEQHPYTIEQLINEMILRCRELKLQATAPEPLLKLKAAAVLSVGTINYVKGSRPLMPL